VTKALLVAANLVVLAVYVIGSGVWVRTGDAWYRSLERPAWQPPDVVFGLIWPYNFIVLGVVGTLVAFTATSGRFVWIAGLALSVVGALSWAYLFYVQQSPAASAWALAFAAVCTVPLVIVAFRYNTWAGVAMLPYLVWLCLATSLAVGYAVLNPQS
jgi:benzodiazapine receptor